MPSKHREQITSYSEEEASRLSQAISNDEGQRSKAAPPSACEHSNTSDTPEQRAPLSETRSNKSIQVNTGAYDTIQLHTVPFSVGKKNKNKKHLFTLWHWTPSIEPMGNKKVFIKKSQINILFPL